MKDIQPTNPEKMQKTEYIEKNASPIRSQSLRRFQDFSGLGSHLPETSAASQISNPSFMKKVFSLQDRSPIPSQTDQANLDQYSPPEMQKTRYEHKTEQQ